MSLARKMFEDVDFMNQQGMNNLGMNNLGMTLSPHQMRGQRLGLGDFLGGGLGPLRNEMFDQSVSSTIMPAMDYVETAEKVCFHFDLPGIRDKGDIELSIDNNVLHMSCDKPQICCLEHTAEERTNLSYHRHERSWGKFERSVRIPTCADISKITSCYKNGVLSVSVEKFAKDSLGGGGVKKLVIM